MTFSKFSKTQSRVNTETARAIFLKQNFLIFFTNFGNKDFLKQMAVAHSILTLDGGFQLFLTAFDLFFIVLLLILGSGAILVVKIGTTSLKNAFFGHFCI